MGAIVLPSTFQLVWQVRRLCSEHILDNFELVVLMMWVGDEYLLVWVALAWKVGLCCWLVFLVAAFETEVVLSMVKKMFVE